MAGEQEYVNASTAFSMDPELRNLLMQTMAQAAETQLPAEAASPFKMPQSAADQFRMTASLVPPPMLSSAGQQSNTAAKTDMLSPNPGSPPPEPTGAPNYSPMKQFGPTAAIPTAQSAAAPSAMPGAGRAPGIIPTAATLPRAAPPSTGQQISAFLRGLGTSDAILPAIGGGMAAVDDLERQGQVRNQTIRALMSRGLDVDTATAAASNPEILKTVLPTLFGGGERKLGEDYDPESGQARKFFYNEKGPANIEYIGGGKRDPSATAVTRTQATANVKRVEKYKNEADSAREMIGSIQQIRELRKTVPDALKGLPPGPASTIAGWTDYFGLTDGVKALSPKELDIQLGFTERTKGAITDREMALFAGGTPGFGMTDAAADKTMAGMEAVAQRQIERAKFFESWLSKGRGSLEGAQDAWDSYITANPVITRNSDGTLSVNKTNIGNWKGFIGDDEENPRGRSTNFGPAPHDMAGVGDNEPGSGGATDVERWPVVNSQEDYDALKPGATFIDIDEAGKRTQHTKPR